MLVLNHRQIQEFGIPALYNGKKFQTEKTSIPLAHLVNIYPGQVSLKRSNLLFEFVIRRNRGNWYILYKFLVGTFQFINFKSMFRGDYRTLSTTRNQSIAYRNTHCHIMAYQFFSVSPTSYKHYSQKCICFLRNQFEIDTFEVKFLSSYYKKCRWVFS